MPEKVVGYNVDPPSNGDVLQDDDIVITGISGRMPECDNMAEFREHLINGEDMVTDDDRRWPNGNINIMSFTCINAS
jgi:hypothetical protein